MCTVLLPPGHNPIAVNKYIIPCGPTDTTKLTVFRHIANTPKNVEINTQAASFFQFCLDVKFGLALKRKEQRLRVCENKVLTRGGEFRVESIGRFHPFIGHEGP